MSQTFDLVDTKNVVLSVVYEVGLIWDVIHLHQSPPYVFPSATVQEKIKGPRVFVLLIEEVPTSNIIYSSPLPPAPQVT